MRRLAFPVATVSVLLAAAAVAACGPGQQRGLTVEHVELSAAVEAGGALSVQEQFTVRFDGSATEFRRRIPVWRHDGVSTVAASMDGSPSPTGRSAGQVEIAGGDGLDVRWHVPPAAVTHEFQLRYRLANAVGVSGIRGTMSWLALPAGRGFDAGVTTLRLALPPGAVLLEDPWMDQPGWTVERLADGMAARRESVPDGDAAIAGVEFTIDQMSAPRPRWQYVAELADEFVAAFISAGLFILVIGGGVLAMLRARFPIAKARGGESQRPETEADLAAAEVARAERAAAARDLVRAGAATLVFGAVVWGAVLWWFTAYGFWLNAIPASICIVGVMFVIAGARSVTLTESGARAAKAWRAKSR